MRRKTPETFASLFSRTILAYPVHWQAKKASQYRKENSFLPLFQHNCVWLNGCSLFLPAYYLLVFPFPLSPPPHATCSFMQPSSACFAFAGRAPSFSQPYFSSAPYFRIPVLVLLRRMCRDRAMAEADIFHLSLFPCGREGDFYTYLCGDEYRASDVRSRDHRRRDPL